MTEHAGIEWNGMFANDPARMFGVSQSVIPKVNLQNPLLPQPYAT